MPLARVIIEFASVKSLNDWFTEAKEAEVILEKAILYHTDALDESRLAVAVDPRNSFIVRAKGQRPKEMELNAADILIDEEAKMEQERAWGYDKDGKPRWPKSGKSIPAMQKEKKGE